MTKGLIIIDMNKSYRVDTYNAQEILDNQLKLIDTFYEASIPIIVVTGGAEDEPNPVMISRWGNESEENRKKGLDELEPAIANAKYTVLIKKPEYDAFFKTNLEEYCKEKNITELYFCGVYSGVCVYFSAAGAAMRRIQPFLVTDAASTEKKEWHEKNCTSFETILGPLRTTEEVIQEIRKEKEKN